jgi:lipopolysaccharide transport system ATP-binding protein
MSEPIISVERLSKRYWIGHQSAQRERYTALRDVIMREGRNFARKAVDLVRGRQVVQGDEVEEFWALKDVSFDVKEGEIIGIIGRNGAGKSTLLKILSRITEPTEGRVVIRGRVSSLLEVGTGFHPELTGRENIYLNGAILGMTQREIRKKFDEIVAFAEVEKFLDTPAKRYSSGMYVRLAFAIAAHLEPEVLVVDEVLAVGDSEFQNKCLGKMDEVSRREGRTVLFVSHDMDAIERLTSRCVLLGNGRIVRDGPTKSVVTEYLRGDQTSEIELSRHRTSFVPGTATLQKIWVETSDGHNVNTLRQGEPFRFMVQVEIENVSACDLAVVFENERQSALFTTHLTDLGRPVVTRGSHVFAVQLTNPNFRSGQYLISFAAFSPDRKIFYDVGQIVSWR